MTLTCVGRLLEKLLSDALEKKFWDKLTAGYPFSLIYDDNGNLALQVGGYTDGLVKLFENLLQEIIQYETDEGAFSAFKDKVSGIIS
jgi:secreted Zn-dependent insulinase-like peptidase